MLHINISKGIVKIKILVAGLILLSIYSCEKSDKTEITLLCKNEKNATINEVYLIENSPRQKESLDKLITSFNKDLKNKNTSYTRTFLKPHENGFFDFLFPVKPIDYSKTQCKEIDNMDIIYQVRKFKIYPNKDTIIFRNFN